jgi:hypothetical protein
VKVSKRTNKKDELRGMVTEEDTKTGKGKV